MGGKSKPAKGPKSLPTSSLKAGRLPSTGKKKKRATATSGEGGEGGSGGKRRKDKSFWGLLAAGAGFAGQTITWNLCALPQVQALTKVAARAVRHPALLPLLSPQRCGPGTCGRACSSGRTTVTSWMPCCACRWPSQNMLLAEWTAGATRVGPARGCHVSVLTGCSTAYCIINCGGGMPLVTGMVAGRACMHAGRQVLDCRKAALALLLAGMRPHKHISSLPWRKVRGSPPLWMPAAASSGAARSRRRCAAGASTRGRASRRCGPAPSTRSTRRWAPSARMCRCARDTPMHGPPGSELSVRGRAAVACGG